MDLCLGEVHFYRPLPLGVRRAAPRRRNRGRRDPVSSRSEDGCLEVLEPGLYRVCYDDGVVEDMEPDDVYEGVQAYDQQSALRFKDFVSGKPSRTASGSRETWGAATRAAKVQETTNRSHRRSNKCTTRRKVTMAAADKKLLLQNHALSPGEARGLDDERLGYWEYYRLTPQRPRPLAPPAPQQELQGAEDLETSPVILDGQRNDPDQAHPLEPEMQPTHPEADLDGTPPLARDAGSVRGTDDGKIAASEISSDGSLSSTDDETTADDGSPKVYFPPIRGATMPRVATG